MTPRVFYIKPFSLILICGSLLLSTFSLHAQHSPHGRPSSPVDSMQVEAAPAMIAQPPEEPVISEAEELYLKALESFRRGQSESTIRLAIKSAEKIKSIDSSNEILVLKVYKLLITSYKNTDQDGKANRRFEDLFNLGKTRFVTKETLERKLEQTVF